jgi:mono/diheme cytochrome c family protein
MKMQTSRQKPSFFRSAILCLPIAFGLAACNEAPEQESENISADSLSSPFGDQAAVGAEKFAANCAACHGANLEGSTLGPLLSGRPFMQRWGERTPSLLFSNIKANMPPGGNEGLDDADYLAITAHILNTNGVDAITAAITTTTEFKIADNASAQLANRQRSEPPAPEGITVAGNVSCR